MKKLTVQLSEMLKSGLLAAGTSVALSGGHALAHDPQDKVHQQKFEMVVVERTLGAAEILDGDIASAMNLLSAEQSGHSRVPAAPGNLCVAHTLNGELAVAKSYCEAAVARADRVSTSAPRRSLGVSTRVMRRDLAAAYSNRGVMNALMGDLEAARLDLEKAKSVSTSLRRVTRHNLARLDSIS